MYRTKRNILFTLLLLIACGVHSQDIHFSQFYQTPLALNPALAGAVNGTQRLHVNFKEQWKSLGANYKTSAISYDFTLFRRKWPRSYFGMGVFLYTDKAGDSQLGLTQGALSFSSIIALNDYNILSAGFVGGFAQRSINYDKLTWDNQFDGEIYNSNLPSGEINTNNSTTYIDFGGGIAWSYGTDNATIVSNNQLRTNLGFSVFHVNQPEQRFYSYGSDPLHMKFVFHGNSYIGLQSTVLTLLPSFVYFQQGSAREINLGAMFRYMIVEESKRTSYKKEQAILMGGYYRLGDAFIPTVFFEIADVAFGVSYDFNLSSLSPATSYKGSFEISLRYTNASHLGTHPTLRFIE